MYVILVVTAMQLALLYQILLSLYQILLNLYQLLMSLYQILLNLYQILMNDRRDKKLTFQVLPNSRHNFYAVNFRFFRTAVYFVSVNLSQRIYFKLRSVLLSR